MGLVLWGLGVKYRLRAGDVRGGDEFRPLCRPGAGRRPADPDDARADGGVGDALIVAAAYLAVVGLEGYVVTPYVMGRSLDLNGTTVLITCLFWGFLWGLVGLVLAMPITVCFKLVCQTIPELHRWAELMSRDWQTPAHRRRAPPPCPTLPRPTVPALRGRSSKTPGSPASPASGRQAGLSRPAPGRLDANPINRGPRTGEHPSSNSAPSRTRALARPSPRS